MSRYAVIMLEPSITLIGFIMSAIIFGIYVKCHFVEYLCDKCCYAVSMLKPNFLKPCITLSVFIMGVIILNYAECHNAKCLHTEKPIG
jgi:hypothetical protein